MRRIIRKLMGMEVRTSLGSAKVGDIAALFAMVGISWAALSWLLHVYYLFHKGLLL